MVTVDQGARTLPVFICHRRDDGASLAQLLYEKLHGRHVGGPQLNVIIDEYTPATDDWTDVRQNALKMSGALIFIATPGAKYNHGSNGMRHSGCWI